MWIAAAQVQRLVSSIGFALWSSAGSEGGRWEVADYAAGHAVASQGREGAIRTRANVGERDEGVWAGARVDVRTQECEKGMMRFGPCCCLFTLHATAPFTRRHSPAAIHSPCST